MLGELLATAEFRERFSTPQQVAESTGVELEAALRSSWENPVEFPPLQQSVFPGDQVVLVLQHQLPHPLQVITTVVDQFKEWGLAVEDLSVVVSPSTARTLGLSDDVSPSSDEQDPNEKEPTVAQLMIGQDVLDVEIHDPDNSRGLSYVAANEAGQPVYLNRRLVDADWVVPISAPLPGRREDCLYPEFADAAGSQRIGDADAEPQVSNAEIRLANEMLGAFFSVLLIYGPGQALLGAVAGARDVVESQARKAVDPLWQVDYQGAASMALATIETEAVEQTWTDVVDAVRLADRLVPGDGPLVVWTELAQRPGDVIRRACQVQFDSGQDLHGVPEHVLELAEVLRRRPVYLHSRLDEELVEDLGLGFLASTQELMRVSKAHDECLLIRDAHRCQPPPAASPLGATE